MMEARTFEAKYRSERCPADCGEPIEAGDEVKWSGDHVVHAGCEVIDDRHLKPKGSFCPRCWTERSVAGACACDE